MRSNMELEYFHPAQGESTLTVEFAVPVKIIAPTLVQIIRRKRPPVILQLPRRRLPWRHPREHLAFPGQSRALAQIAKAARGHHILPRRAAASAARDHVIERQVR